MPIIFFLKNKIIFSFFIIFFLIFYRSPHILIEGRFLAEEGNFFFRNSFLYGPVYGLFQVIPAGGYFELWTNIASVFATFVSLEYAPLVTVYFSLIVLFCIFVAILNFESELFITDYQKYFACLVILLSPPMTPEVWLTSLHSKSYFAILIFILLFQKDGPICILKKKYSFFLLFISGLSSIYACVLWPIFLLKYLFFKNKKNFYNFVSIFFASCIQFVIIFYFNYINIAKSNRFALEYDKIISFCYNILAKSFFGKEGTYYIITELNLFTSPVLVKLLIFIFISSFFFLAIKIKDKIFILIILSFIWQSIFVIIGSMYSNFVGGRYGVVPGVFLIFLIFRIYQLQKNIFLKIFFSFFLASSLIAGFYEYKYKTNLPKLLYCLNCPSWKEEVAKWKNDQNYHLRIWDYPNERVKLTK